MRLISKKKKSFYVNDITIVEILNFLQIRPLSIEVLVLNSNEKDNYYYAEDIQRMKSIQEICLFFESKKNLRSDIFTFKYDDMLFDIEDDYSLSLYSEDSSKIESFTIDFCSRVLKCNNDLISNIMNLDGKYALVDLGIIVKEFPSFEKYIEDLG